MILGELVTRRLQYVDAPVEGNLGNASSSAEDLSTPMASCGQG